MTDATRPEQLENLSEDELRTRIVIPLLVATPGLRGVTDVHGRNEKGLDVVFFEDGSIERLYYGLQLKAEDIRGGATPSTTVKHVIDQLGIAQDLTHPIVVDGRARHRIDRFIVATSGRISDTAREEIAGRLDRLPVAFWDGSEIARRINLHMPELLSATDGTRVAYLKSMTARFDTLDALDVIPGIARRTLTQIYEEPHLRRRFDPSFRPESDVKSLGLRFPALKLRVTARCAVVVADQDGGKTALLRMLAIRWAHDYLSVPASDPDARIPVLLHARDIVATALDTDRAVRLELQRLGAADLCARLGDEFSEGRCVLLVDGFSELLRHGDKDDVERSLIDFSKTFPKTQIIVAARPADFLQPKHFVGFTHFTIEDFDQVQVASLLRRWTSDSAPFADVAKKLVRRVREALQLPGSPISATIGVMLYEKEGRYITNVAEAVERYMVIRLGRYAHELGITQRIEWTRKQDLLSEVAYRMVEDSTDRMSETEVINRFNSTFERLGEDPVGQTVLEELVESGVLATDGSDVMFHRSAFRDFFAAHAVNQLPNRDDFFRTAIFDRKWGLVLTFAAGLRRKNTNVIDSLTVEIEKIRSAALGDPVSDYFYGAYVLGRILSNSELTDRHARLAALRTSLRACVDSIPQFVESTKLQFGNIGELAALIGIEHTFFVTVGVPWLERQFRDLLLDPGITEEERYLVTSTYASLGCKGWLAQLDQSLTDSTSTRILVALSILLRYLKAERDLTKTELTLANRLEQRIRRRLAKPSRKRELKRLLELKSKLVELEIRRLQRLEGSR